MQLFWEFAFRMEEDGGKTEKKKKKKQGKAELTDSSMPSSNTTHFCRKTAISY